MDGIKLSSTPKLVFIIDNFLRISSHISTTDSLSFFFSNIIAKLSFEILENTDCSLNILFTISAIPFNTLSPSSYPNLSFTSLNLSISK